MTPNEILSIAIAVGTSLAGVAFSAGIAMATLRMTKELLTQRIDALKEDLTEDRVEQAIHATRIEMHGTSIAVLKTEMAQVQRKLSPWQGTRKQDGEHQ